MSRTKQEVSSAYQFRKVILLPLIFTPIIDWSSLIEFAKISAAVAKSIPESGRPGLTPRRCNSKKGVALPLLKGLGHAILGNFREFQHGSNSHRIN